MINELLIAAPWLGWALAGLCVLLLLVCIFQAVSIRKRFSRQEEHWQRQLEDRESEWLHKTQYHQRLESDLTQQLQDYKQQLSAQQDKVLTLSTQAARQEAELSQAQKSLEQQSQLLENAKTELKREFELTANRLFDSKNQQFSSASQTLLENTLSPFKTQLQDFRKKVEDVYEKENAERIRLSEQVLELRRQAHKIGEDAVNLARALKGSSKTQGGWGEVVLERLLEQSGLHKGREYETQLSFQGADGSRRMPDVVVHLPEGKDIIIDAKVSLTDYERYCNADSDLEREKYLRQHIQSLRAHIRGLSAKDYENIPGLKVLDFVFIFVPIEAAFMLALQYEPGLYKEAYDKQIILASPTTLLAILRTVENIWRYEKQNKNAEKIALQAGALHDQFVLMVDAVEVMGTQLDKTRETYDKLHGRLTSGRGNLVKRVNDIRKLGAKTKRSLSPELLEDADSDNEALDGAPGLPATKSPATDSPAMDNAADNEGDTP